MQVARTLFKKARILKEGRVGLKSRVDVVLNCVGRLELVKAAGAEDKEMSVVVCIDHGRSRIGKLEVGKHR